ncbi:MAG: acyl-CoA dehydrogenase family protein [Candidatus Helarchaeota archaeon]
MYDILLDEEQKQIKYRTREYVRNIPHELLRKMDKEEVQYPTEYVKGLANEGLLGVRFPKKYGGQGLNWVAEIAALEEIGVLGSSLGCLYSLPSIIGEALNRFGTEEQKKKYLEPILKGKIFCAEALTEPRGGSDFFGATCLAEKKNGYFIVNGQKRFVVGSEGADVFLVYVKTDPKAADPRKSISTFIIERDFGVEVKHVYGLMGSRGGGTGRLYFKDVEVPEENLIGNINEGGLIFNQMMIPERMTSAGGAIGSARAALEIAARYSTRRKAFGRPIMKFQGVTFKIADSITLLDAARSLVYATARNIDANGGMNSGPIRRMVSESKKFATDTGWQILNHAMQIMGGIGYTNVYPIERLLRDARLTTIWTGTNEIMNLLIQHEYYRELQRPQEIEVRDVEQDAVGAEYTDEKVYE